MDTLSLEMMLPGEGSEKLANDLSLALDVPESEREKAPEFNTGYDSLEKNWELIVRYNGNLKEKTEELGGSAVLLLGGYAVVTIPEEKIEEFAGLVEVEYIEKPHRLYFDVIAGAARSCVVYVWEPPYLLSGRGVITAVIDSGIDWRNNDFRNEDGTTRILRLWDQTVPESRSGYMPPEGYNIGTEYTKDIIDRALQGDEEALKSVNLSVDYSGHGTFVTGIAAGNGRNSQGVYRGMAYESDLLIVKLGESIQGQFPRTTRLMEAVNYVIMTAIQLGRPVAINLSFGNNQGSHDGTDLLSSYLDAVAAVGRNVIVCGSGNEAGSGLHTAGQLNDRRVEEVQFAVGEYETAFNLQLWKNYADEVMIELVPPGARESIMLRPGEKQIFRTGDTTVYINYGGPTPYSRFQQIYFEFVPKGSYVNPGVWIVRLTPVRIVDGRYDLWLPESGAVNSDTGFFLPSEDTTLTVPSAADKVITVGAYNSATDGYADFSGRGYTRSDRSIKPDLVAPGVNIRSVAVGGGYTVRSGTSMATPFVTGGAALMMEWGIIQGNDPYLYGEKIKAYMIRGARPLPGEPVPSPKTGWGALCVSSSLPS